MSSATRTVATSWNDYDHFRRFLGCGSSTLSKAPRFRDAEPALIERGLGCRVWDADGNEYIDYTNGLGPITLGHAIPELREAILSQLDHGIIFGRPHRLEGEVAELLCEVIPCAERVRFLKTGGEAIAACIRIARHATGRKYIVQCGYNGWLNNLGASSGFTPPGIAAASAAGATRPAGSSQDAPPSSGVSRGTPDELSALHVALPWGDTAPWEEAFAEHGDEIAAVVIASSYPEMERGAEFLPRIRELSRRYGAVMIMDEIVTGFRLAIAGAEEYFGFEPDLAVFAKGMANGMPISAYLGREDLIELAGEIPISTTFGGETLSLAVVKAVIDIYRSRGVIDHLWSVGQVLWTEVQRRFHEAGLPIRLDGVPVCPTFTMTGDIERDALLRSAYRNGLLLYNVPYITFSHREPDVEETLNRFDSVINELSQSATAGVR